ncbi:diphthine synthase, partial [Candidatus Micrarchaeota archaeon]|nr:diphthine synthase [Candidatus Micrarchaeota archaeon]
IPFKAIPSLSIIDFVSLTGLSAYRFGGITSIVFPEKNYAPESFYDVIAKNKKNDLHSLCLLDIKAEEKKFMSVKEAIEILEGIEAKRKEKIISESILVGMSAVGSSKMQLKAGRAEELKKYSFGGRPHSLIVCSRLSEFELNALKELSEFNE